MRSLKHVTNTWLLAVLLYGIVTTGSTEFGLLLFMILFGAVFSLPALAMCLLLFSLLSKAALPPTAKLVLWLLTVTLSVICSAALVCYLFIDSLFTWQVMPLVTCAVIATWMAILLRLNFFFQRILTQTKAYEKDLV